jgi:hypothetical protein
MLLTLLHLHNLCPDRTGQTAYPVIVNAALDTSASKLHISRATLIVIDVPKLLPVQPLCAKGTEMRFASGPRLLGFPNRDTPEVSWLMWLEILSKSDRGRLPWAAKSFCRAALVSNL